MTTCRSPKLRRGGRGVRFESGGKPLFERGPSALIRFVVVSVLSLVLMIADHREGHLEDARNLFSTLVYPLQYTVDLPIRWGNWLAGWLVPDRTLQHENQRLRQEHLSAQLRLKKYEELEAENRRLRELLNSTTQAGERVSMAKLLSVGSDPFSRYIVLNKGVTDGVRVGQSLIDAKGVMGQVVRVGSFSAGAVLITDPGHALPVQIKRNGLRTVATGTLERLRLDHVPINADVVVGDRLITSGLGGRFPAGYLVGRVIEVERSGGRPFARVIVEPSSNLERNREVLLVWTEEEKRRSPGTSAARLAVP